MQFSKESLKQKAASWVSNILLVAFAMGPTFTWAGELPFNSNASHILLMDADTGAVLAEKDADAKMFPSSMSKLMTLYVLFDELKKGSFSLDDVFYVSENAWKMQGSKMFVPIGKEVKIRDLISGIATQSGNDACVVVAEGIAGSEEAFAVRLNETAKRIGLTGSHFVNASGWPNEEHYMTARDLVTLAKRLKMDFPEYFAVFAEREFTFNGIRQFNRNSLLDRPSLGVDGLKTGHTEIAGYGITLTATHPVTKRSQILVVNGLASKKARIDEGGAILQWGFANFENIALAKAGAKVGDAPVFLGKEKTVPLGVAEDIFLSVAKTKKASLKAKAVFDGPLPAPIKQGDIVGELVISSGDETLASRPLVALEAVEKSSLLGRVPAAISHWLGL